MRLSPRTITCSLATLFICLIIPACQVPQASISPTSTPARPSPTLPTLTALPTTTPERTQTAEARILATRIALSTQIGLEESTDQAETRRAVPLVSPTPTSDLATIQGVAHLDLPAYRDAWNRYTHEDAGISFEYPALYDEVGYCRLEGTAHDDGSVSISLGARIQINMWLEEATIDEFIASRSHDFSDLEREPKLIGGLPGIYLTYRYGSLGRYAEAVLVKRGAELWILEITVPTLCDFIEAEINEFIAFQRIIDTFRFLR